MPATFPTSPTDAPRRLSIFVVGLACLVVLWLPPFPFPVQPTDVAGFIPAWLSRRSGLFSMDRWVARWDYFIFPPLFVCAVWETWRTRTSLQACGLTSKNFAAAARFLLPPTLLGALLILLIAGCCGNLDGGMFGWDSRFWKRLIPIPALLQQMAIQLYFHRQLRPWFGNGRATAWILALYFVALHAPNPGLMLGTLFGMYFWARCYQRHPNLYALALSHAFLSALFMSAAPKWLLPSVSIGRRFVEKGVAQGWWPFLWW